jgi:hypothetical protein
MNLLLVVHGCIILLLSQFAGYAFFFAIRKKVPVRDGERTAVERWRMSHNACSAGAVFLLVLGPVSPHLRLSPSAAHLLDWLLIVSTYGLCLGTIVAGFSGHRGMDPRGPWSNVLANIFYIVGVLGSTAGGVLLMYGAWQAFAS